MPKVSAKPSTKKVTKNVAPQPTAVISSPVTQNPYFPLNRKTATIVVILLSLAALYFLRSWFIAAMVNGKPVLRLQLIQELEKQGGKQALNNLISKELIFQEAKKQNVTITEDELNKEIKTIEESVTKQGQSFEEFLKSQNLTRVSLKEQLRIEKTIQKIIGKDIKVTDEEVNEYIAANKDSFPPDANIEELKKPIRDQLQQEKVGNKFQTWLDNLHKQATIHQFLNF